MFVRIGEDLVVQHTEIRSIDCSELEQFKISVRLPGGYVDLEGQPALDLLMAIKPSALEGKRFRFARGAWAFHNLVAHPALQVLAWLGLYQLGFKIHDATVPRPKSERSHRS